MELRLIPIQGIGNFVSDIIIQLSSDRTGISTLGVASGRNSKMSKELLSHSAIQGFSISSFLHCDVRGVTMALCILINNIKETGSVREEISWNVTSNLDMVARVEERCAMGCTGTTSNYVGIEYVREI